ncbi:EPIDERMAL PATTERNING FACTOR-like protein 5 [Pyrus ussuriensis x Pyrus communis]|uniref:EPIDERMAL PATTERNING FACTOR-like protein 5 n=1 Tax=Pyrus ussuriensis x Pyrus communis TaxID=2448454 RepID=A0A5N5HEY1_9ROSA|nr:EPIDERMAL PATTERNING FACTOR-like protein 5 [Pyrus ussuriensis x Pyrus communis]
MVLKALLVLAAFGDEDQSYIGPLGALDQVQNLQIQAIGDGCQSRIADLKLFQVDLNHGGHLLVDFDDPIIRDLLEQVVLRKKTRKANAMKWMEMEDAAMDEVNFFGFFRVWKWKKVEEEGKEYGGSATMTSTESAKLRGSTREVSRHLVGWRRELPYTASSSRTWICNLVAMNPDESSGGSRLAPMLARFHLDNDDDAHHLLKKSFYHHEFKLNRTDSLLNESKLKRSGGCGGGGGSGAVRPSPEVEVRRLRTGLPGSGIDMVM